MTAPNERPRSYTRKDPSVDAHLVLERALDAGYIPDSLRPHFHAEMGYALLREALETMEVLEGDAEPCQRCREQRREAWLRQAAARGRQRALSASLALGSLPASVVGLYAFGAMSPWWGFAWFAAALGCLVLSVLTEDLDDRRQGRGQGR